MEGIGFFQVKYKALETFYDSDFEKRCTPQELELLREEIKEVKAALVK